MLADLESAGALVLSMLKRFVDLVKLLLVAILDFLDCDIFVLRGRLIDLYFLVDKLLFFS